MLSWEARLDQWMRKASQRGAGVLGSPRWVEGRKRREGSVHQSLRQKKIETKEVCTEA
ncbi:MAG: hypothetical protein JG774_1770 [Desulfomicrobiaceae bacterium]|jgi:hypothetical protein|nr:hypothetical protein [Desulfomicrobiaceae bacterium]MDI3492463.1 hypothetical protein [Desulfomicrobiaceae bacterium]MDK2873478.1 hypothetical protein [Desulfomicrobiaceae bacterium]